MQSKYDEIWNRGSKLVLSGNSATDDRIDDPDDLRRGITLIFRPSQSVLDRFDDFLRLVQTVEPGQYRYARTEIHTTVMTVISCTENFGLDQIDDADYAKLIQSCVDRIDSFAVDFKGITASAGCVMAQGFPLDNTLARLRELLREKFNSSTLQHTIDEQYTIEIAHSTLIRFRSQLSRPRKFFELLSQFRSIEWGRTNVFELELVFNDWYHKSDHVGEIARFRV